MPTLERLLNDGYFPRELPPPFNPRNYGSVIANTTGLPREFRDDRFVSQPCKHNLSRSRVSRRHLSIPNPVNCFQLSEQIARNWNDLITIPNRSTLSLSKPVEIQEGRAINRQHDLNELDEFSAKFRSTRRYALIADISRCYPSIYTHSIPWALHTKPIAKAIPPDMSLLGNIIDRLIRNGQDRQTMGIPIGPDSSHLLSEIILSTIDQDLVPRIPDYRGFRYVDDYELCFSSRAEAESALHVLQELLTGYELALNDSKTYIEELPINIVDKWVSEIRSITLRDNEREEKADIIRLFDYTFEMSIANPNKGVLKYTLARLSDEVVGTRNWPLLQDLILQCLSSEPGVFPFALDVLSINRAAGRPLNREAIEEVINNVIVTNASIGHGSEVVWAIWGAIGLNYSISIAAANAAESMNDNLVALSLLDSINRNVAPSTTDLSHLGQFMTGDNLQQENWLLAYEADLHGWLPSSEGTNHVDSHSCFSFLKNNGVSFYDSVSPIRDGVPLSGRNRVVPGSWSGP